MVTLRALIPLCIPLLVHISFLFFPISFARKDFLEILMAAPSSTHVYVHLPSCTQVSPRSREKVEWVRMPEGVWGHRIKYCIAPQSFTWRCEKIYFYKITTGSHGLYKHLHTRQKWICNRSGNRGRPPPSFPSLPSAPSPPFLLIFRCLSGDFTKETDKCSQPTSSVSSNVWHFQVRKQEHLLPM